MQYFSTFRFDERRGTLWTGDREVGVTRKAADLLRCLLVQAGSVVSHDAILSAVWGGTHVQPENIKVLISELRRALGDHPRMPRFIRTEPGRGYSFVASLSETPPRPSAADVTESASIPFVDQRDHLSHLAEALAAASGAESQMVLVEGDRGSGKTALCDRFLASLRRTPLVRACYGQCFAHTVGAEPYAPVIDALEQLARQSPGRIAPLLARHAPTWLAQLPAWIRDAAGARDGASAPDSSRMIREFSALVEYLGAETSTVIVLDDLHWADLDTIDLVRAVMRRHTPLRTLVVGTYTPAAATLGGAALQGLAADLRLSSRCLTVRLTPLDEGGVRDYLRLRFGRGTLDPLAPLVHALTGGTPLAVRSAVDALVAAEYLVAVRGGWRLRHTPSIIEASLPARVVEVIAWRFDQLDSGDRAIVEFAAAVGVEFSAADIARAAGADHPGIIAQRLDALQRRGFIGRVHDMGGRGDRSHEPYRFLHEMHADVLAARAPAFQQVKAAERLAHAQRRTIRRA